MLKFIYRLLENSAVYDLAQKLLGEDRVLKRVRETIGGQLKNINYDNVLEVGCGTGFFADFFKASYTGIDINEDYIIKARTRGAGNFFTADATRLSFEPESYDLIFTLGVLHHLEPSDRALMFKEMWRVCKTGGHILLVDGLIPANRLNLIGYVLARLDRGGYKMRINDFRMMAAVAYPHAKDMKDVCINSFPYELVAMIMRK